MTEVSNTDKVSFMKVIDTLKKYESDNTQAWWSGKKVYLGYTDKEGWKLYELSLWDRICRTLFGKYEETRLNYIKERFKALSTDEIQRFREDGEALPTLLDKASRIAVDFVRITREKVPVTLPASKEASTEHSLQISDLALTAYIDKLLNAEREPLKPVQFPIHLSNCGNRCYLNSVLQLMLRQVDIKQRILDAFDVSARQMQELDDVNAQLRKIKGQPESEDLELRQSLEKQKKELLNRQKQLEKGRNKHLVLKPFAALILHLEAQTNHEFSETTDRLADQIRLALFKGQFHNDLKEMRNLKQQQDAGVLIEIMFKDLLDNLMETSTVDRAENDARLIVERMTDRKSALVVNFDNSKEETPTLTSLVESAFVSEQITRRFDKGDGSHETTTATSQTRITGLPDTVVVHINRTEFDLFTEKSSKIERNVSLSPLIDFAPYCSEIRPGESYQYQLVGYNVHGGRSLHSGHYTAYVMIGDKYFACDDMGRPRYKEISREEFYGEDESRSSRASQAYLVMLKRVEAPVAGAPVTVSENS